MVKKIFASLIILAAFLGAAQVQAVGHAGAASPISEVEFVKYQYVRTHSVGGIVWIDLDGSIHIRDRTDYGTIKGSINGTARVSFNCDLDANGDGEEYGTITIYETEGGVKRRSAWIGEWTQKVIAGYDVDGRLTAKGLGGRDGLLLRITKVYRVPTDKAVIEIHMGHIKAVR